MRKKRHPIFGEEKQLHARLHVYVLFVKSATASTFHLERSPLNTAAPENTVQTSMSEHVYSHR